MRRLSLRQAWTYLKDRTTAYKLVFGTAAGEEVLKDLAQFCRANASTFEADPRKHAALEGRREVWLRIQKHLNLSAAEVFSLTTGGLQPPTTEYDE